MPLEPEVAAEEARLRKEGFDETRDVVAWLDRRFYATFDPIWIVVVLLAELQALTPEWVLVWACGYVVVLAVGVAVVDGPEWDGLGDGLLVLGLEAFVHVWGAAVVPLTWLARLYLGVTSGQPSSTRVQSAAS